MTQREHIILISSDQELGFMAVHLIQMIPGFEAVVCWQAQVIELQQVGQGQSVGYGGSYVASHELHLATIGLGYADGYLRALSNRGEVLIEGCLCPIVEVGMDLITVGVGSVEKIKEGMWVEIMGLVFPSIRSLEKRIQSVMNA